MKRSVDINIVRDGNSTHAFGIFKDKHLGNIPFAGSTKKNPNDGENKNVAEAIAVGRAYRALGRRMVKETYRQHFHKK